MGRVIEVPKVFACIWLLISFLAASATAATTVAIERTYDHELPEGWAFQGSASESDRIRLSIALRESKIQELKTKLSKRWKFDTGNHLSRSEVGKYLQPDRGDVQAVSGWLISNGIRDHNIQGSWISFEASVQTVKSLFQADLAYYAYNETRDVTSDDTTPSKPVLRTLSYTVPSRLSHSIDFVHPLTNFMIPRSQRHKQHMHHMQALRNRRRSMKATSSSTASTPPAEELEREADLPCLTGTFPECIRKLYNITYSPPPTPSTPGSPSPPYPTTTTITNTTLSPPSTPLSPVCLGIAGFLEQYILHSDVSTFLTTYAPEIPPGSYNFTVELFNNASNPQGSLSYAGMEASLDVEYAMALGYPSQVTYYITGGRGTKLNQEGRPYAQEETDNEPYLEFLEEMVQKEDGELPHVLSISYADDEKGVPVAYARRVCDLFAALTARGVSVLAATGDGGAAGTGQTQCVMNDGSGRKAYVPTFPASCPYVTAVGATENVGPPVTGADFSTGGFSAVFERPEWQEEVVGPVVERMVEEEDVRLEWFNKGGRAIPDISAIGTGFQIQYGGRMLEVLGTSASTPVVAAMVALVNDARMRAGKKSLGWLNPLLYSADVVDVLRDVVDGASYGCRFPNEERSVGWPTLKGYDLVTGLGTVDDFHDFLTVLLQRA